MNHPSSPGPASVPARPLLGDPRALIGFFTRLPVGGRSDLDDLVRAFPLVALVGWVTGALAAGVAVGAGYLLPPIAAGAVVLVCAVGLTGLNQTDGLMDVGDGLMVHGDPERRRAVMQDHSIGAGGAAFMVLTYVVTFAGFSGFLQQWPVRAEAGDLVCAVLLVEVLARAPYLLLAALGRPSHPGLGSAVLDGFGTRHLLVGLVCAAPVLLTGLVVGWTAVVLSAAAVLVVSALGLRTAHRSFGGVGGDVMGATQEISRAALVLTVLAGVSL